MRRRVRRLLLAVVAGTALAGLLGATTAAAVAATSAATAAAATSATAAPPKTSAGRVMSITDVYIRDVASDVGLQPQWDTPVWASPDVKVCATPTDCATSVNPVVGSTSHIVVKLRNPGPYGSGVDSGTLWLFRSIPGGGHLWPSAWVTLSSVAVVVPPGVTTVIVPWSGVPGPAHFSVLALWTSPTDPLLLSTSDILNFVRYNNNVAWRDLYSVL
ncbi:hypothetical protein O7606_27170 [Micromonospora sp. WMMD882]|uniref:hypothetical protein n=1 Tax=Micromonospora sp. WMMD882 TaxID=3015151 RepID=UPI00248BC683|nr:hypothetical protein [Micromonospora sp. WMMD882]WBB79764.1 hypothetical protein O7606_27170 [Micromonospora sp. WMMD882]